MNIIKSFHGINYYYGTILIIMIIIMGWFSNSIRIVDQSLQEPYVSSQSQ